MPGSAATIAAVAASVACQLVAAQGTTSRTTSASSGGFTPLAAKRFTYPGVPYKADTDNGVRGPQYGYNICNSTTEGPNSLCQTSFINSVDDFCLWAPPEPNSVVGNTEGEMVAWCTKPGRGTRLIPAGALKGVQFVKAPAYVQVVGFVDQTKLNIQAGDYGGEMDPHGADQRGNPLGGLLFSQAFGSAGNSSGLNATSSTRAWTQAVQWHNFMGADMFCLKACDPAGGYDYAYCEHIYDRIGCAYNAPANYAAINGTFQACLSDNQLFPGVYVSGGRTLTYTQPPESLGEISTIPYVAAIPASSQCTNYTSASIYAALGSVTGAGQTTSSRSGVSTSVPRASTSGGVASLSTPGGIAAGNAAPTANAGNGAGRNVAIPAASALLALVAGIAIFA